MLKVIQHEQEFFLVKIIQSLFFLDRLLKSTIFKNVLKKSGTFFIHITNFNYGFYPALLSVISSCKATKFARLAVLRVFAVYGCNMVKTMKIITSNENKRCNFEVDILYSPIDIFILLIQK